jgi:DNA-binding CsgD family transcriptional regulator
MGLLFEVAQLEARGRWARIAREACPYDVDAVPLRKVCERVLAGEIILRDAYLSTHQALLVTTPPPRSHEPCRREDVALLQHAVDCTSLKAASFDYRLSASQASQQARRALQSLGLSTSASKMPLSAWLLLHAARCPVNHCVFKAGDPTRPDSEVLFAPRPDLNLLGSLPPCEAETVRLYIDGSSHAQIASLRGASARTVANQLASVFRKLGVSGRFAVMHALACGDHAGE